MMRRDGSLRPAGTAASHLVGTILVAALAAGCGSEPAFWDAYAEIVGEEDARGLHGTARIQHHLGAADPAVRAMAVRALGRFEDPQQLDRLEPFLADPDPGVRAVAASAVAQSVLRGDPGPALAILSARVGEESDVGAMGALATNLGRLGVRDEEQRQAAASALATTVERLLPERRRDGQDASPPDTAPWDSADHDLAGRLGLARGIEAFARGGHGLTGTLTGAAHLLATTRDPTQEETAARIRRLAVAALLHAGLAGGDDALRFLADRDPGVRRLAVAVAGAGAGARAETATQAADEATFAAAIRTGLADLHMSVRVEALRAFDRRLREDEGCGPLLRALGDPNLHVSTVAIELAAAPCPLAAAQRDALREIVEEVDNPGGDWRRPARALHSLATVAPTEAAPIVPRFARHGSPFARAWAVRAAALTGDAEALRTLANDPDPNVRTAALNGLGAVQGADARQLYAAQLGAEDPLLVMTAVRLLRELEPDQLPVAELLDALARFTATGRETVRDVRMALLDAVGASRGYDRDDLAPYLADFDPLLAARAATLAEATDLGRGGGPDDPGQGHDPGDPGQAHDAAVTSAEGDGASPSAEPPRPPLTPAPTLTAARLQELDRSSVTLRMAGLGEIVIDLLPRLAATNADRFARLAEAGYFDGLTFHRVEPNFVIQGGSPHANEYAGDGPYSRDEIGSRPHWRGAVGLSTRGRDTGDAQIFVDLVDNVRLDFNYTIFGQVVAGMEVVDAVQEGAVIQEARVERR